MTLLNGKRDHPRTRFEKYVEHRWGKTADELSREEREIALVDWQGEEIAARIQSTKTLREQLIALVPASAPWAIVVGMFWWAMKGGG